MKEIIRKMALQLLNEDPTDPPADPGGTNPPADPPADPGTPPAGADNKDKPFATFPDEKSFMARIKREAANQQAEFLKSLGFEDENKLKDLVAAQKKKEQDEMTEAQKLQQQLKALEGERDTALTRAETVARTTEAKLLATELGVSPTRINHFLKLADIGDIKVYKDGGVDTETMKTRLSALLNELPEFKGTPAAPRGGGDFGGSNTPKPKLTIDQIKTMTKEEIADRIVEVREVMGQK